MLVNGRTVPEHISVAELGKSMESCSMQTFAVACEALRNADTCEAYEVLKNI